MPISVPVGQQDIQLRRNVTSLGRSHSVSELTSSVHLPEHSASNQSSHALVLADEPATNSSNSNPVSLIGSSEVSPACRQLLHHSHISDYKPSQWKTQNVHREKPEFMKYDQLNRISSHPPNPPILIRFNISGERFIVTHSTLQNDTHVYRKIVEKAMWLSNEQEYYIERDPTIFRCVHNYLRLGELHLPMGMCGTLVEKELEEYDIMLGLSKQRCCLGQFLETKCKLKSLQEFENGVKESSVKPDTLLKSKGWQAFREAAWMVINSAPDWTKPELSKCLLNSSIEPNENSRSGQNHKEIDESLPAADERSNKNVHSHATPFWSYHHDSSYKQTRRIRLFRGLYLIVETPIALAAVLLYTLSTVEQFRNPLINGTSDAIREASPVYYGQLTALTIPKRWILIVDIIFAVVFTLDMVARILFCPKFKMWLSSIFTFTDLISLIPYYCELVLYVVVFTNTYRTTTIWIINYMKMLENLRGLKLLVVFRPVRALRWYTGTYVLLYTVRNTLLDVGIVNIIILTAGLFFGAAVYYVDSNFPNIPKALYWAVITFYAVGYGDMTASTTAGYSISVICVLLGGLLLSYMIPILVDRFLLYYNHSQQLHMLADVQRIARLKVMQRDLSNRFRDPTAGLALDAQHSPHMERKKKVKIHRHRVSDLGVGSYSIS
ncbi:unnamed protein product [Calicophoron daubneyi]|uniref:Uncharacterized protein n=1 Tax=Calicophoron daubneyi TaxID=300641 RepID=A0AAV2TH04_CALDB